ncbi:MAG TPA: hypothetical protein V6D28_13725 [Leptolyngbyaceae cyanobacterium]
MTFKTVKLVLVRAVSFRLVNPTQPTRGVMYGLGFTSDRNNLPPVKNFPPVLLE